jgi:TonB-dependent SusC/RagA subfamily outer membrane receptor
LKDGAASAVYGSRVSNGVIITTRGKEGKTK